MSLGLSAFQLTYEISPIIMTGGSAQNIPGGMLPLVSLTESLNFVTGLLSGGNVLELNDFFAHFVVVSGGSLIMQKIGEYPFANQAVAANATITDPLEISLKMICPAKASGGGYITKLSTMTALQSAIAAHNAAGGTYTVATPSYFYTNCILLGLTDTSANASAQPQTEWTWRFRQPLLTQQQADQAQNNLMSKLTGGTAVPMDSSGSVGWSGLDQAIGLPASLASSSIVGAAQNLGGALVASPIGQAASSVQSAISGVSSLF